MKEQGGRGRAKTPYKPRQQTDGTFGLGEDFGRAVGEILQDSLSDRDLARWRAALRLPPVRREEA